MTEFKNTSVIDINSEMFEIITNIWYKKMNSIQRYEIMQKVYNYKSLSLKMRVCFNYIKENINLYI